ncbi:MAG: zf-HC2 domain-containing protein [Abditibacteriales bacterium]|nr:zf-HC2 domain-containing protein [Abditibacteriales bacterium]MDW8365592.1 zf-HC2 domain-containing protein [Abditibacteriales bacterium]
MRCQKVRRLLSAYDDGELPVRLQCRVQEHLHRCPQCQAAFAQMQRVMWVVEQAVQLAEPPPHLAQSVMSALPSPEAMRRRAQRRAGGFAFGFLSTLAVTWGLFHFGLRMGNFQRHDAMPPLATHRPLPDTVASAAPALKPKLEEELIPRPTQSTTGPKATTRTGRTQTIRKTTGRRAFLVRHIAPKSPRPPSPPPPTAPEPPLESSPAIVMVRLGSEVEQQPTAEVRTVSSPPVVRRPHLTAELTSASWDTSLAADGG